MKLYLSSFGLGDEPEELLRLLGGRRRVAVILNATDPKRPEDRWACWERERDNLSGLGLEPVEFDLRRHFGDPKGLEDAVSGFDLVWVRGGNTFVLRRAFRQSGADVLFPKLLAEDRIVYGGFSAGSAIMTPSLRGIELVDDPTIVPSGYERGVIWEGLGLVPYTLAPHYRSDHPESEHVDRMVEFFIDHHVPFRALRDGQAIVVEGPIDRVVGKGIER